MNKLQTFYFLVPRNIGPNLESFEFLATVNISCWNIYNSTIVFDFVFNGFFAICQTASFGALVEDFRYRGNDVKFLNLNPEVEDQMWRNGYLPTFYNSERNEKSYTSIEYRKFKVEEERPGFERYVTNQLIQRDDFPRLSIALGKKIVESILEIYNNAYIHGNCKYIHTAGSSTESILRFSIANMGTTIRKNVNNYFRKGKSIDGKSSIEWAVQAGSTTKNGTIPGGLGFNMIREFLSKNGGQLQVISSTGFWQEKETQVSSYNRKEPFLGTIVNLEFNLLDKKSYILSSERIDPKSIF